MTPRLSRQARRRLERQHDTLLARVQRAVVVCELDAAPHTHLVLAAPHIEPQIVDRRSLVPALRMFGFVIDGLNEVLADVDAEQARDPERAGLWPVLLLVDGHCSVAFIGATTAPIQKGGAA